MSELERQIFNETAIQVLTKRIVQHYQQQLGNYADELNYLENELAGIKSQTPNLVEALAAGGVPVQPI